MTQGAGAWTIAATALLAAALGACGAGGDGGSLPELAATATARSALRTSPSVTITATTCDGFPRLAVETPPGVCVGVAADGFTKLRGLGELPDGDLVAADTGSVSTPSGSIYRLHRDAGGVFERRLLVGGLDRPASVAVADGRRVYVGAASDVVRIDPDARSPVAEVVVSGLPSAPRPPEASEDHYFKAVALDPRDRDALYVTVGSGSNVCEQPGGVFPFPCPELAPGPAARAEVRRYSLRRGSYEVVAAGLRNPFAVAVHPGSGLVVAADNGRDHIDALDPSLTPVEADLPHEALDVLVGPRDSHVGWGARLLGGARDAAARFGWPYCYDDRKNNPEYPSVDCRAFARPAMLLPAHAAPLGMAFYTRRMFPPAYRGALLVGYHGFRDTGHRLVVIPATAEGEPRGRPLDVVRGWAATATQPAGQPVAVLVARDGAILVTNDETGQLLRIVYDPAAGDGAPMPPLAADP